ncbi:Holliday junction resolvase-like protein [uncultured Treponema sp.]|uniref:Holliday junction resolvase-like protein n=1 Tax=uncultured Treponema sp. TaxID=162155 RepID=UPI0015AFC393|nr:Holliday junction resolvase-like protein [uncultured Treponema sp.]
MSTQTLFYIAAGLFAGILIGSVVQKLRDSAGIKKARNDAVKRSRAVLGGQFGEQLAPFLPDFPCNPGDARFIGKPVDYIAFPGTAEGRGVEEILLIEVKSGTSTLSAREKEIREAVKKGRVRYVEYRIPGSVL